MTHRVSAVGVFVLASLLATSAFAQGSYVGAFLVGDVVRLDQYDSNVRDSGNGEAFGFGLRLGTPIGRNWGVELEFVRPGEITTEQSPQILPLPASIAFDFGATPLPDIPNLPNVSVYDPVTFPAYSYSFRARQRRTTLSTSLWVSQEISRRFSLTYLGGVSFGRTNNEIEIRYLPIRTILPIPSIAPMLSESINYSVDPMVGVEGRIRMGGQVDLVPGLRLHGIDGGWMIRPALGLAWTF
jgi:hypothetical protein